jgi:nucleoside-diphosphate-sugar epimerase
MSAEPAFALPSLPQQAMARHIIISGATSQIGVFCVPLLSQAGYHISAISRQAHTSHSGVTWFQADLHQSLPQFTSDAHIFLHLAGISLLPALLPHLPPSVMRVLAFSSTSRFSKQHSPDPRERALAQTLAEAEHLVSTFCHERGIACTIFRPTLIYGCGRDHNLSFIARMILRYGFFPLPSAGRGLRQPVHAHDLACACVQALENPRTYGHSYNLSGSETLSYRDMVIAVFHALGKKPRLLTLPSGLMRSAVRILKCVPRFQHLSLSMLQRIEQDLCFDHHAAQQDFGYTPRQQVRYALFSPISKQ